MSANGVDDLARGNLHPSDYRSGIPANEGAETGQLGMDDESHIQLYNEYNGAPPPAPRVYSRGMLQTDVTYGFNKASAGLFMPQADESE